MPRPHLSAVKDSIIIKIKNKKKNYAAINILMSNNL